VRRLLIVFALAVSPLSALAAGWTAELLEDEGGQVMVASVAGDPSGKLTPMLEVECAGDQGVMLRYLASTEQAAPGDKVSFLFENESKQVTLDMAYEDMDGAFAAYFPKNAPIIDLLENGPDVTISESSGNYPAESFSLRASTKAIGKVLKGCAG
jgi:hypothetical protein